MMGPRQQRRGKLFYTQIDLEERVPADHVLRRIAAAVSWDFVRPAVADRYGRNGRESLDPILVLKLMLLLFLEKVRSERELMRQLGCRLDWLWFCGLDVDDAVPDHSVLSKARRRWGLEVFESLFDQVLSQCVAAGLVEGATLHADSTVLKAHASVDSRVSRRLWAQLEAACGGPEADGSARVAASSDRGDSGEDVGDDGPADSAGDQRSAQGAGETAVRRTPAPAQDTQAARLPAESQGHFNAQSVSRTDPDAATTRRRGKGVTLGYRDHCVVDDRSGVVVATIATPADQDDASMLPSLLEEAQRKLHRTPRRMTGDSAYGTQANVQLLESHGVRAYLKPRRSGQSRGTWQERLPAGIGVGAACHWLKRRLSCVEGRFAHAHERMGHHRCRWRRRWRVQIQCYLVAMGQNILKLARRRPPTRPLGAGHRLAWALQALAQHPPLPPHPRPMLRLQFQPV